MPSKHQRNDEVFLDPIAVVKDVTYPNITHIWGWSFDETAGSAVELEFRNGGSTGDIIAWVNVPSNASANMSYYRPLFAPSGLHIVAITGAFTCRIYL